MMGGRDNGPWLYAVVCALAMGCDGADPVAPALDGASDLGVAETSTPTDGDTDSGVLDATAPTDRGADVASDPVAVVDVVRDTLTSADGGGDAGGGDAGAADVVTVDVAAPSAEFTAIYETILRPRCATSGCHVNGSSVSRLVMSDAASTYARLVNVRDECSFNTGSRIRVVPFDPAMSAIMIFNQDGLCGRRHNALMPDSYGGDARSADLERFRAWIMTGAR